MLRIGPVNPLNLIRLTPAEGREYNSMNGFNPETLSSETLWCFLHPRCLFVLSLVLADPNSEGRVHGSSFIFCFNSF